MNQAVLCALIFFGFGKKLCRFIALSPPSQQAAVEVTLPANYSKTVGAYQFGLASGCTTASTRLRATVFDDELSMRARDVYLDGNNSREQLPGWLPWDMC